MNTEVIGISIEPDNRLRALVDEAIYVIREVYGQFERPVAELAGDLHSMVIRDLLATAFAPARCPIPVRTAESDTDRGQNPDAVIATPTTEWHFRPRLGVFNERRQVWDLYNGRRARHDQPIRIFPLSSWSLSDVVDYLAHTGVKDDSSAAIV
jgi:3'-phosphoadenosine 5'-phosphosulfate sulfotransferase (PAPS reductase)/FAD synthetase